MKCPECGLEMMIYSATVNADGGSETAYVCRNPQCARYDRRLRSPGAAQDNVSPAGRREKPEYGERRK